MTNVQSFSSSGSNKSQVVAQFECERDDGQIYMIKTGLYMPRKKIKPTTFHVYFRPQFPCFVIECKIESEGKI